MEFNLSAKRKSSLVLGSILLLGLLMRLRHLDQQSLWLDELHTMNECDPSTSWREMLSYFINGDPHPPLFFILVHICFKLFGYTAVVARGLSAVIGTAGIYATYLLAKELLDRRAGYIAAILTLVNYYNLYFSQEARDYALTFLLVALSFVYLVRLIKTLSVSNSIWYAIVTALLLYTHYYSLMVAVAQVVIICIFLLAEEPAQRAVYVKRFLVSGAIIAICYAPWLPALRTVGGAQSFWITSVSHAFFQEYFFEYFRNADLLKPLLILFLLLFVGKAVSTKLPEFTKLKHEPVVMSFVILSVWIGVSCFVPYLRSLLSVPILYPRYTMIVVPAYIVILAGGISFIASNIVRNILLAAFFVLSVTDIFIVGRYYHAVSKAQFREMVDYVCRNNPDNYPMIDEVSSWQQLYYFRLQGVKPQQLVGPKAALIDSVITKGSKYYLPHGLWIVGAHHDPPPTEDMMRKLDSAYIKVSDAQYYDAWAQLYLLKADTGRGEKILTPTDFGEQDSAVKYVAIWSGSVQSKATVLEKGKYRIVVSARGTKCNDEYAKIGVSANNRVLGSFYTTPGATVGTYELAMPANDSVVFRVSLLNDRSNAFEDRNAFLHFILVKKID
jgi:hypothetical protein